MTTTSTQYRRIKQHSANRTIITATNEHQLLHLGCCRYAGLRLQMHR